MTVNEHNHAPRRALIIGDSISIGYTPVVAELLADWGAVEHNPGNALNSANILAHLDEWLGEGSWDVIYFNSGLHDLRRMPPEFEPLESLQCYEANLHQIVRRLRAASTANLLFATTTPVIDERHQAHKEFKRFQKDVEAYNNVGLRVMTELKVPTVDLHGLIQQHGPDQLLLPDGVHYPESASRLLAEAVANAVREERA